MTDSLGYMRSLLRTKIREERKNKEREERKKERRGEKRKGEERRGGEKRREGELIRMAGFVSAPSA